MTARKRTAPKTPSVGVHGAELDADAEKALGSDGTELPADGVERTVELTGDGSGESLPPADPDGIMERVAAGRMTVNAARAALNYPDAPELPLYNWRPEGYESLSLVHRNGHLYVDGRLPEKVAFTPAMWAALTGDGLVHNPNVGVNEDKTEISVSAVGVAFGYRLEEQSDPEHWYLAELTDAEVDPEDAEYTLNDYGVYFRG